MKLYLYLVLGLIFCFYPQLSHTQAQKKFFEPYFAYDLYNPYIINPRIINDLGIFPDKEREPSFSFGGRLYINLNRKIGVQLNANLAYPLYSFSLMDFEEVCNFCPVTKRIVIGGQRANLSISMTYLLYQKSLHQLRFFAGLTYSKFKKYRTPFIGFNGRHPRLEAVSEELNHVFDTNLGSFHLGLSYDYKRWGMHLAYYGQFSAKEKRTLSIDYMPFDVINRQQLMTLGLGYKLFWKK